MLRDLYLRRLSQCGSLLSSNQPTYIGRTLGERIREFNEAGVDPEFVQMPAAYDNDDVPLFTVDPNCDYQTQPRENVVRGDYAPSPNEVNSAPEANDSTDAVNE